MKVNHQLYRMFRDYKYYANIGITNPTTTTDYQHRLNLSWLPGMARDFRDIRFTDQNGTPLYYWIEHTATVAGVSCVVWIKASSPKNIYLFYGNGAAVDASDIDNTFIFGDDFNGSSIDTNKWTATGQVSVSNGVVTIIEDSSHTSNDLVSVSTSLIMDNSTILRGYIKTSSLGSEGGEVSFGTNESGSLGYCVAAYCHRYSNYRGYLNNDGVDTAQPPTTISGVTAGSWFVQELKRYGRAVWTVNDANTATLTTRYTTADRSIRLRSDRYNTNNLAIYADWVLIRKYLATEPTLTLGSTHGPNPYYHRSMYRGLI